MNPKFSIGIDLGTTNSALAYREMNEDASVHLLSIPQYVSADTLEEKSLLPSFLYIPTDSEKEHGTYMQNGANDSACVAGSFARDQAASMPTRTVAAAKSWLCYNRVDRHEPILPWEAPEDVQKVSPVEATAHYLRHLVGAWNNAHPEDPFVEQQISLTVPASFDASARDLTRQAARQAGFPDDFILLEEPQAALYAWLHDTGETWRKTLSPGDQLLVCDVGGGTTDFTLIRVEDQEGELQLNRIAVGNHILVGGDNMDLALAHTARTLFEEKGHSIDAWQSVSLWHACRYAKEQLLNDPERDRCPVTILGRGSKLVGGTITIDLLREQVMDVVLNGFLPDCALTDRPKRRVASGFRQIGLPYESDPGISRHLAQFLSLQAEDGVTATRPTHLLFNGGVLKAKALRERIGDITASWFGPDQAPKLLEGNEDLDHAVARGAAEYGYLKESGGVRIRGGTARAYYVGIETAGLAIPGQVRPLHALCVVPHGMEEGTSAPVPDSEMGLVIGEAAQFRFFSSSIRKGDQPGDLLTAWSEEEIQETDPLEATLESAQASEDGMVPVSLESRVTELGVLELWCNSAVSDEHWKLEFSVRDEDAT